MKILEFLFLSGLLLAPVWGSGELDYFRAVYGVWNYSLLGELGFDAVYQEVWWTEGADEALYKFANESMEAAANNLSYICGPYYEVTSPPFEYVRAVNSNGYVESRTPSRVDETYWLGLIEESGMAIANLSLYYPIWGVVWDMEDYMREEFTYWDYTFDEAAIQKFANVTGNTIPSLPPSERWNWLNSHGLLEDFQLWQEETVTSFARRTEERIHAINPDLNLGILAFEDDSWFQLSILRGFSTEQRPVTAWHEDTYSGYKKNKVERNHEVFAEMGINGKILPGLWTLWIPPYELLDQMEYATRHNGAFWIYQRATYPWFLGSEEDYITIFGLLNSQIFFNGSTPNPLPPFRIYPGIEVRPNLGPDGVSAVLNPGVNTSSGEPLPPKLGLAFSDVELAPDIDGFNYIGRNVSIKHLKNPVLRLEDLPCLIWGLDEQDLVATEIWAMVRELEDLLTFYDALGLTELASIHEALNVSLQDFEARKFDDARSKLNTGTEEAYGLVMEEVWPFVEAGFADPRNSTIPMVLLNKIYTAKRKFADGEVMEGRMYLLKALKDWGEIKEPPILSTGLIITLMIYGLCRSQRDTKKVLRNMGS